MQPLVPDGYTGKFLFIGDSSPEFERTGSPFRTLGGQVFKERLVDAGVSKADIAFAPVLRCHTSKPKMKHVRACAPFVYRTVKLLDPDYVFAMGPHAAKSLANTGSPGSLPSKRGRRLQSAQEKPFTYYRMASLHQLGTAPAEVQRFKEDLKRISLPLLKPVSVGLPKGDGFIGFDTEFTPTEVLCGAVADNTAAITVLAKEFPKLAKLFTNNIVVAHNMSSEIDSLMKLKLACMKPILENWLKGDRIRDTLLVAKLVDENRGIGGYKLESLLLSKYNIADYKVDTDKFGPDPSLWPSNLRSERCRIDAWGTLRVFDAFEDETRGPLHIAHQIACTLQRMAFIGVYVGIPEFEKLKKEVYLEESKAQKILWAHAKRLGLDDFTGTDNDVRALVYDKLGLEVESKTKSGLASASVKDLKEYVKDYPEVQALVSYSKFNKLKTTYVDGLEKKLVRVKNGKAWMYWCPVHINALAAKTGRRASAGPNFQNLPVRVRQIIVSRFKNGNIADNDYSKLEPIIGGWVTGEHKLTEYFTKYPNGYIKIGADFFGKTVEKNTKEYTMMKSLVLAILYKKQKWSLGADLWSQGAKLDSDYDKHVEEAGKVLNRFLDELFPGVREYHEEQEAFVLEHGYVDNAVGQRRRLPLPPAPERSDKIANKIYMKYKAHVINQAVNYPIQSLASYVTGSAMIDWEREILRLYNWTYYDFQQAIMAKEWPQMPLLCIEVHDDLVQDIPKGMEKKTKEVTHDVMKAVPTLRKLLPGLKVQLGIDTNHGPTWGLKS